MTMLAVVVSVWLIVEYVRWRRRREPRIAHPLAPSITGPRQLVLITIKFPMGDVDELDAWNAAHVIAEDGFFPPFHVLGPNESMARYAACEWNAEVITETTLPTTDVYPS